MNRNALNILLGLAAALILSACGAAVEKGGERAAATPSATPAVAAAPQAASTTDAAANVSDASTPATTVAAAQQSGSPTGSSNRPGRSQPAPMPTPAIGSGGNDLFLFTQARAAVNADPELKAANLALDVKDGVVTLSGAVASAAQKSKAEQLVRAVGPKTVKNQLRVSGGN